MYVFLAIPVGLLIDRFGARKSILVGSFLISFSGLLRAFATNFETLLLTVGIFGIGGPIVSIGCPKMVASWFLGKDRGTASGIYVTGATVGRATTLAITNTLIMPFAGNWQNTLALYGLLGFFIVVIWLFFGREKTHTTKESTIKLSLRGTGMRLFRDKQVWIVAIIGFGLFFAGHGLGSWLPKLLESKGMSLAEAGLLASVPSWFGLIGRTLIPRFRKKGSRRPIVFTVLLVEGICIFTIGTSIGLPLFTSLIFYGVSSASMLPLMVVILMDMPQIGSKFFGLAAGIFFSFGEIGGFTGPFMVGFLADLTGSIFPSIVAITLVVETMLIFTLLMKEK
jgi:cyanate permease